MSGYLPLTSQHLSAAQGFFTTLRTRAAAFPRLPVFGLLFLAVIGTLLHYAPGSGGSKSYPTFDKRPLSSQVDKLLYSPEHSTCPFLDPLLGFSKAERQLVAQSSGDEWLGYRSLAHEGEIHPMFGLIKEGEERFRNMVGRRSETLEQAVEEYRRRHKRAPPKGFDIWWAYVTEHKVLMPDEYDSIEDSLAPFRVFTHEDLIERIAIAAKIPNTFQIRVKDGQTSAEYSEGTYSDYWTDLHRDAQLHLLGLVAEHLPDLQISFGVRDEPQLLLRADARKKMVDLVAEGKTLPHTPYQNADTVFPWPLACPKGTPLRDGDPEFPSREAFISRHRSAQDPCLHPQLLNLNGFFLEEKGSWTSPAPRFGGEESLVPIMSKSKTIRNSDILGIPYDEDQTMLVITDTKLWHEKSEKAYWRGSLTGMATSTHHGNRYRQSQRARLHRLFNPSPLFPPPPTPLMFTDAAGRAQMTRMEGKDLKEWGFDVSLSGPPVQCDHDDGTCAEIAGLYEAAGRESSTREDEFKYIIDVDGNAWTSRFRRIMLSNSLILKSTVFPEWNTDILPEYFAYVPIKMDYSDIPSVIAFFRGDPKASKGTPPVRDEVARRIARNGQCWVERTWRKEDQAAYVFRLYLEWARLVNDGGDFEMA